MTLLALLLTPAFATELIIQDGIVRSPTLRAPSAEDCTNGIDDDLDGAIDDKDADCHDIEVDENGEPMLAADDPRRTTWSGQRAPTTEFMEGSLSGSTVVPLPDQWFSIDTSTGTLWAARGGALAVGLLVVGDSEEAVATAMEGGEASLTVAFHLEPEAVEGHELHLVTEETEAGVRYVLHDATTQQSWVAGPGESLRPLLP